MFVNEVPLWEIVLRTVAVYVVVLIGLRLIGKRELGQMTAFDLVLLLLIANAVQNAMVGPDTSLIGGLLAAAALLLIDKIFAFIVGRSPFLRRTLEGTPTLLMLHGKVLVDNMNREGLDMDVLRAAAREHGVADLSKVEMAVLELDGSISIVPIDERDQG